SPLATGPFWRSGVTPTPQTLRVTDGRGCPRQCEVESRAGADRRVGPDAPAVGGHDAARDREPEPGAGGARALALAAVEGLEHARQVLGRDALAGVADGHLDLVRPLDGAELDPAAGGSMAQRVADQIVEHALGAGRVEPDVWQGRVDLADQRDAAALGLGAQRAQRVGYQVV